MYIIIVFLLLISLISFLKQWDITTALLFLIIILIGIFNYNLNSKPLGANHIINFVEDKKLIVIGTVLDREYYSNQEKISLKVKVSQIEREDKKIRIKGLILVNIYTGNCPYEYGDIIKIRERLTKPLGLNNFGEFNYELYLAQKRIFVYTNIWQDKDIQKIGEERTNLLVSFSVSMRNQIKNIIGRLLQPPYNFLLIGMLLGEKTYIPPELKDVFIESGIMHILAVSGLHVGIIAAALFIFLNSLRIPKRIKMILIVLIMIMYASITGFRPSVVRATIMFSLLVVGKLINRNRNLYISLFLAAFLILLINPLILYDAGFLLSFIVTFFIIYLSPILQELFSKMVTWIKNPLSVSMAAWLGIFPLSAYFFNKVSLISIISNIFIIPLTAIAVILGFIIFFLGLISIPLANLIANINYFILILITFLAKLFSSLPFSFVYVAQPLVIFIFLYYIMLFFIIEIFYRKIFPPKLKIKATILILSAVLVVIIVQIFYPLDNIKVNFINVGEGDCILIEAPKKYNILIDGGGTPRSTFDVGGKIVIPYLRRKGINKINLLVLTHPHLDHLEGLLPILREFKVDMVLDSGLICDISEYREFISIIKEKNIPYHQAKAGDNFIFSKYLEILLLNPIYISNIYNESDFNNASIVVKLFYKNSKFLFTGDIEETAEKRMLIWQKNLKSDVLKVAHHGSSSSSSLEFVNEVDPIIAVISVSKNHFGHPSPKIIERLEDKNIKVYRTDKNGTIIIRTDGKEYWVRTLR
ncbi:MAG: DNA internalization-related competence protein ComEC/Rec2 [Candidatus Atribacteria bacterium]